MCFRCTANDTVRVEAGGQSAEAEADPLVNDGVVRIEVSGLAENQRFATQIFVNGVVEKTLAEPIVSGSHVGGLWRGMRTFPRTIAPLKWGVVSCARREKLNNGMVHMMFARQPDIVVMLDDPFYGDDPSVPNPWQGETHQPMEAALTTSNAYAVWRTHMRSAYMRYCREYFPLVTVPGDHCYPYDDWCHDVDDLIADGMAPESTQDDADMQWWTHHQAVLAYCSGNPLHLDGAAVSIPPQANSADEGHYPSRFWSINVAGVTVTCLDMVSHKSGKSQPDNTSKTMLGAGQKAWFKSVLQSRDTPVHMVLAEKEIFTGGNNTGNADGGAFYTTEMAELRDHIHSANGYYRATGLFLIHGDHHQLSFIELRTDAGDAANLPSMSVAPVGSPPGHRSGNLPLPNRSLFVDGAVDPNDPTKVLAAHNGYGLVSFIGDGAELALHKDTGGRLYSRWVPSTAASSEPNSDARMSF